VDNDSKMGGAESAAGNQNEKSNEDLQQLENELSELRHG